MYINQLLCCLTDRELPAAPSFTSQESSSHSNDQAGRLGVFPKKAKGRQTKTFEQVPGVPKCKERPRTREGCLTDQWWVKEKWHKGPCDVTYVRLKGKILQSFQRKMTLRKTRSTPGCCHAQLPQAGWVGQWGFTVLHSSGSYKSDTKVSTGLVLPEGSEGRVCSRPVSLAWR